jgi:hypothetical protein
VGAARATATPNGYGWDWTKDVNGALAFVRAQEDVDPERSGALGLSTGADVLIEVAAHRHDLAALVVDGAAAGSFEAAADGPVEHWNLPEAHHTDALHEHAGGYERRVVDFFNEALL